MRTYVGVAVFGLILVTSSVQSSAQQWIWSPLDRPGFYGTRLYGISDGRITAQYKLYSSGSAWGACIYNAPTWTTIVNPFGYSTVPRGISGNTIVGSYYGYDGGTHGFRYDGTTFQPLDHPDADPYSYASGIEGNTIVGYYLGEHASNVFSGHNHAFVYDGNSWQSLDYPGAVTTALTGISGRTMVGWYQAPSQVHGFVYDGTNWSTLTYPGHPNTQLFGISGNNIIGKYWRSADAHWHGCLYDGINWSAIDYPGAVATYPQGISGNTIVGYYTDTRGADHGFILTVPEPATLCLLLCAGCMASRRSWA